MPPDLALLSTLFGSNYPCLEQIFMVPKVFEPLKFDCKWENLTVSEYFLHSFFLFVGYVDGVMDVAILHTETFVNFGVDHSIISSLIIDCDSNQIK